MVVAGWNPERAAEGFVGAARDVAGLEARLAAAAGGFVEEDGWTGRGGLKDGPLRRAGAAFGGIVSVMYVMSVNAVLCARVLKGCDVGMFTRGHVPAGAPS